LFIRNSKSNHLGAQAHRAPITDHFFVVQVEATRVAEQTAALNIKSTEATKLSTQLAKTREELSADRASLQSSKEQVIIFIKYIYIYI